MSYDPQAPVEEKSNIFGVIVHSFFVIPFLLAVFSVLLFLAVRVLTTEQKSAKDYLQDVTQGGVTKRWQAAFELSRILSHDKNAGADDRFAKDMREAFKASIHDDQRVRQYLALAMGSSGNQNFVDDLIEAAKGEKDENLSAIITALGILKNNKAVDVLIPFAQDDNAHIRLATVIALGNIGDSKAKEVLKAKLNDSENNVVWDAAIALAKMGDNSGKAIILSLMNREYLATFPNVDIQEQNKIIVVAIEASRSLNDPDIRKACEQLFASDKNMNVRTAAQKSLQNT